MFLREPGGLAPGTAPDARACVREVRSFTASVLPPCDWTTQGFPPCVSSALAAITEHRRPEACKQQALTSHACGS